jgi:hypothetical protein
MATENNPRQAHPGIGVIDVSIPESTGDHVPRRYPAASAHESNKVNEKRGLLGLAQGNGPNFCL